MTNHPEPLLRKEGTKITPHKDFLSEFRNTLAYEVKGKGKILVID